MRIDYGAWAARSRVPLGFAFALAFLIVSHPTRQSIAAGMIVAFVGIVIRGLAAGCIEKNATLATGGPFRYTRNPLYFGSFILGAGFIIAGDSIPLAIAFVILFALIYAPVMRREEAYLRHLFGPLYDDYARQTPLFFPIPGRSSKGRAEFHWRQYWKNREYQAAIGWIVIFIFLFVKSMLR
ncbi:MAG TPA: isoprenylcysteine carboxylmethyltransferase family protein [Terriglobia bacterium]|nr:isoprenylcysteine carboxylmethyltransferase family protein [Terriglobia bacterium]